MKAKIFTLGAICLALLMLIPSIGMANKKKKANQDTEEWRYEIEPVGTGAQGFYQIKVWSYSKKAKIAMEQSKKNAVHGVIFKGFADKNGVKGQKPLARNPNLEQEQAVFFKQFFEDGGRYQKYVTLTNNGAIAAGDRLKVGKQYKIGTVVSVNVAALRKDLESAGIIQGLGSGF